MSTHSDLISCRDCKKAVERIDEIPEGTTANEHFELVHQNGEHVIISAHDKSLVRYPRVHMPVKS